MILKCIDSFTVTLVNILSIDALQREIMDAAIFGRMSLASSPAFGPSGFDDCRRASAYCKTLFRLSLEDGTKTSYDCAQYALVLQNV